MTKITYDDLIEKIPNKYELTVKSGKKLRERQAKLFEKETFENISEAIDKVYKAIVKK